MAKKLLTLLLLLLLSTGLLAASVYLLGTCTPVMQHLLQTHAPAEKTGLPASEYPAVAAMTTAYLAGKTDTFQHPYSLHGTDLLAFNQKEQQHMADVQMLFRLAWKVMVINLCLALIVIALTLSVFGRAVLRKMLMIVGVASIVGVVLIAAVAALDFERLFVLFHRVAFTNDLWLLDPRTDLLIRLMPTSFFVTYAAYIGGAWALMMGLVTLLPLLLTKERNQ